MKTLGVLGGMGPSASLDFYSQMIDLSGKANNEGYPHILLSNLPVPDYISDRSREEEAVLMAEEESRKLELAGADFLVMTCNTMHLHLPRFREAVSIPFLSMIDLVCDAVDVSCIGVLGSPTTIETNLYQDPLARRGVTTLVPEAEDQNLLTQVIFRIITGEAGDADRATVLSICDHLVSKGAESIVLGCTELPVLLREVETSVPFIRSTDILAKESWRLCS